MIISARFKTELDVIQFALFLNCWATNKLRYSVRVKSVEIRRIRTAKLGCQLLSRTAKTNSSPGLWVDQPMCVHGTEICEISSQYISFSRHFWQVGLVFGSIFNRVHIRISIDNISSSHVQCIELCNFVQLVTT